jgi:hypothetical protein
MNFLNLYSKVTGGETISLILLFLFTIVFAGLVMNLVKKFRKETTNLKTVLGIVIFFVVSFFLTDFLIGFTLFPNGEYVNFGATKGIALLLLNVVIGLATVFILTQKIYYKIAAKT